MPTVRIWAIKSDHNAKAVKRLADKLVTDSRLGNLWIQTADQKRFLKNKREDGSQGDLPKLSDTLEIATQRYLEKNDCVIFVADSDSPMPIHQRSQELDSLNHHIVQVVNGDKFDGKVFLAQGVEELGDRLQTVADADRAARMAHAEAHLRQLCVSRGLDWEAMTEVEREDFVNDLIHEDRECSP